MEMVIICRKIKYFLECIVTKMLKSGYLCFAFTSLNNKIINKSYKNNPINKPVYKISYCLI